MTKRLDLCRRHYGAGYRIVSQSQRAATANHGGSENGTLGRHSAKRHFQLEKTLLINSQRRCAKRPMLSSLVVKGQLINEFRHLKILGVIFHQRLRYDGHVVRVAAKGLRATLALKWLRGLWPSIARQLFVSTITPSIGCAPPVWCRALQITILATEPCYDRSDF